MNLKLNFYKKSHYLKVTNSRKQPTYRCGEQFHLTRQHEPVDAMVTEAVLTRLSSVDVHDLVRKQK